MLNGDKASPKLQAMMPLWRLASSLALVTLRLIIREETLRLETLRLIIREAFEHWKHYD